MGGDDYDRSGWETWNSPRALCNFRPQQLTLMWLRSRPDYCNNEISLQDKYILHVGLISAFSDSHAIFITTLKSTRQTKRFLLIWWDSVNVRIPRGLLVILTVSSFNDILVYKRCCPFVVSETTRHQSRTLTVVTTFQLLYHWILTLNTFPTGVSTVESFKDFIHSSMLHWTSFIN